MHTSSSIFRSVLVTVAVLLTGVVFDAVAAGPVGAYRYSGPVQSTITRTITNGSVINLGYGDDTNIVFMEVLTNTVNGVPSAFLVFQTVQSDLTSFTCVPDPIIGQFCRYMITTYDILSTDLPAETVVVTKDSGRIYVDVTKQSLSPVFSRCVVNDFVHAIECTDKLPTGVIDVTVTKTNESYSRFIGAAETKFGPQIIKSVTNEKHFSARPIGSILGWRVSPLSDSNFGENANKTVVISFEP